MQPLSYRTIHPVPWYKVKGNIKIGLQQSGPQCLNPSGAFNLVAIEEFEEDRLPKRLFAVTVRKPQ